MTDYISRSCQNISICFVSMNWNNELPVFSHIILNIFRITELYSVRWLSNQTITVSK